MTFGDAIICESSDVRRNTSGGRERFRERCQHRCPLGGARVGIADLDRGRPDGQESVAHVARAGFRRG